MVDTPDFDEQDAAEVFDEDNTNLESQREGGKEDAEQFEDLVDVFDVTSRTGDADDDEAEIGEDLDDDDIVESARDDDEEDDDPGSRVSPAHRVADFDEENDLGPDDPDVRDGVGEQDDPDEVELTYVGDLSDVAGAASGAGGLEADELDDDDLSDLDYKD